MFVQSTETKNLRGLQNGIYEFTDGGINLILGKNGSGKTSILEAVYLTNSGESFRTQKKLNLIKTGEEFSVLTTVFNIFNSNVTVSALIKNITHYTVNNKNVGSVLNTKTSKDKFRCLLFTPDDIQAISGAPVLRRDMFDRYIGALDNRYFKILSEYNKVLKQRNALLKSNDKYTSNNASVLGDKNITFNIWNLKLTEFGNQIIEYRDKFITKINEIAQTYYNYISQEDNKVSIYYKPNTAILEIEKLNSGLEKEKIAQTTLFGPHRDDYEIYLQSQISRYQLSRGEQRTTGLSLLFATHQLIKDNLGFNPVLLLDDIASELDSTRVKYLMEHIPISQAIITTTEKINSTNISKVINL